MLSHCGFNLHYSDVVMLSTLSYVSGPVYVLLGEVSVQVLCPVFNWIVCLPDVELYEFFIYFGDQTFS